MTPPTVYSYDQSGGGPPGGGSGQQNYDPAVYEAWLQYYAQLQQAMPNQAAGDGGVLQQQMYGQSGAQQQDGQPYGNYNAYFDSTGAAAAAATQPVYVSGMDMSGGLKGWNGQGGGGHDYAGFGDAQNHGYGGGPPRGGGGRGGFGGDRDGRRGGFGGGNRGDRGGFGSDRRGGGDRDRSSRFNSGGGHDRGDRRGGAGGGRFNRGGGDRGERGRGGGDRGGRGGGDQVEKNIIFVAGLPQSANAQFIHEVFSALGEIETFPDGKPKIKIYDDHGVSKGECTITFRSEEMGQRVIDMYNGQPFPGNDRPMEISIAEFKSSGGRGGRDGGGGGGGRGSFGGGDRLPSLFDTDFGGGRGGGRGFGGDRGPRDGGFGGGRGGDRGNHRGFGGGRGGGGFGGGDRGFRGGRGGDRGGRGRGGDRGGRGGIRGGRGEGPGRGSNAEARPNDWICECGNNNFSFRRECNSCKQPRSGGAGAGDRHRPY